MLLDFLAPKTVTHINFYSLYYTQSQVLCYSKKKLTKAQEKGKTIPEVKGLHNDAPSQAVEKLTPGLVPWKGSVLNKIRNYAAFLTCMELSGSHPLSGGQEPKLRAGEQEASCPNVYLLQQAGGGAGVRAGFVVKCLRLGMI